MCNYTEKFNKYKNKQIIEKITLFPFLARNKTEQLGFKLFILLLHLNYYYLLQSKVRIT